MSYGKELVTASLALGCACGGGPSENATGANDAGSTGVLCARNVGPVDADLIPDAGPVARCTSGSVCMAGAAGPPWECCIVSESPPFVACP
jgi:hypothetical protein